MRGRPGLVAAAAAALLQVVACQPAEPVVERVSGDDGRSMVPAISDDGRFVAFVFQSRGSPFGADLVADVIVHDRTTGETSPVNPDGNGPSGFVPYCYAANPPVCVDGPSSPERPAISDDGRVVAYTSFATDLAGAVTADSNVYATDRSSRHTTLVSRSSAGVPGNGSSLTAAVSGDGRFVTFWSYADNLVPGDTNESPDIFVHDLRTGATTRVNTTATGGQSGISGELFQASVEGGPLSVYQPAPLSDDGRYVAFLSVRTDLAPGGATPQGTVYRKDRSTGAVARINDPGLGERGDVPWISADGSLVSYRNAYYFDRYQWSGCASCIHIVPTAPRLRLVRHLAGAYNQELVPGTPFPGAPDVSGDGSLFTFATGGRGSDVYMRRLPGTPLVSRHRINVGGPRYEGRFGKVWDADRGFVGGTTRAVDHAIEFTADEPLYRTERLGRHAYDLAVPDGRYRVRLLVADTSPPRRPRPLFDVAAEGAVVLDDVDLRTRFFDHQATTVQFVVPVTDGRLDIDFRPSSGAPSLAAIEVLDARPSDRRTTP